MENSSELNLPELTESCISVILSFTTPRDVCRLSAVSRLFTSAANGDSLWNKFIPQQCYQILPRAVTPIEFASKRELYFRLCDPVLIDGGTQSFSLERSTGKIKYMLSATELSIAWGKDQRYWNWVSRNDSRFGVLAELRWVCWFDVSGGIDCRLLSEDTQYIVVFVLKFAEHSHGWTALPINFSVTGPDGQERESSQVFMEMQRPHRDPIEEEDELEDYDDDEDEDNDSYTVDHIYEDAEWLEVVAGEFTLRANGNEGVTESSHMECKFSMREVDTNRAKAGLFLDGVRIEPVNSSVGV
jgi:hypothetical protein